MQGTINKLSVSPHFFLSPHTCKAFHLSPMCLFLVFKRIALLGAQLWHLQRRGSLPRVPAEHCCCLSGDNAAVKSRGGTGWGDCERG